MSDTYAVWLDPRSTSRRSKKCRDGRFLLHWYACNPQTDGELRHLLDLLVVNETGNKTMMCVDSWQPGTSGNDGTYYWRHSTPYDPADQVRPAAGDLCLSVCLSVCLWWWWMLLSLTVSVDSLNVSSLVLFDMSRMNRCRRHVTRHVTTTVTHWSVDWLM